MPLVLFRTLLSCGGGEFWTRCLEIGLSGATAALYRRHHSARGERRRVNEGRLLRCTFGTGLNAEKRRCRCGHSYQHLSTPPTPICMTRMQDAASSTPAANRPTECSPAYPKHRTPFIPPFSRSIITHAPFAVIYSLFSTVTLFV